MTARRIDYRRVRGGISVEEIDLDYRHECTARGSAEPDLVCVIYGETPVRNPWAKKNPFLSMWLSGANAVAGTARGRISAEAKRQASTVLTESSRQMLKFWTGGSVGKAPGKRTKRR